MVYVINYEYCRQLNPPLFSIDMMVKDYIIINKTILCLILYLLVSLL